MHTHGNTADVHVTITHHSCVVMTVVIVTVVAQFSCGKESGNMNLLCHLKLRVSKVGKTLLEAENYSEFDWW